MTHKAVNMRDQIERVAAFDHPKINAARAAIVDARNELGLTTAETLVLVVTGFGRSLAPDPWESDGPVVRDPESWQAVADAGRKAK